MQKSILLIRHPDTGINVDIQKPADLPASYEEKRICMFVDELRRFELDSIITSDFERARQTAEFIGKSLGLLDTLVVTDLLREVLIWPDLIHLGQRDTDLERERVRVVLQNTQHEAYDKLKKIIDSNTGNSVGCFTHGNFIRCIIAQLRGDSVEELPHIPIAHLSITSLHFDTETSRFTLQNLNDTLV